MHFNYQKIPLSLYIHVPWCEKKCPYCDFNSHQYKGDLEQDKYVNKLLSDLDEDLSYYGDHVLNRPIHSIFIGGGTPSLFSPVSYSKLLCGIQSRLDLADQCEVTIEANPGSSEVNKFQGFREAGINRLSIGVQSFDSDQLKKLGRVHSSQEALNAGKAARTAGFENFNLDLMFGLPGQTVDQATQDLATAIDIAPSHLSLYQLTIEPNTLFHHNPPVTPDDETLWEMQDQLQRILMQNNYSQYEVSAYSKPEQQSQHNLNYWQFGDYLGIGAGAHAKVTSENKVNRSWKIKHPQTYLLRDSALGQRTEINPDLVVFEYMLNALRLKHGFCTTEFEHRTGSPISSISELLDKHQRLGLIEQHDSRIRPTDFGFNMLNNMLEDYLERAQPTS